MHKIVFCRSLHHPNILTFIDILRVKLSFADKVAIVMQVTQALVYMHTRVPAVVHLDLKPENILVSDKHSPPYCVILTDHCIQVETPSMRTFVGDFGLGKVLHVSESGSNNDESWDTCIPTTRAIEG